MSSNIQVLLPAALIKVFAVAGFLSATILVLNAAKRSGIIPTTPFTQLAAPVAQLAAIGLVIGIYLVISRKVGVLGISGAAMSVTALAGLVGVEFVLNLVFPYLDRDIVAVLRHGPLAVALTAVSLLFLVGTAIFMLTLWRTSTAPKGAVLLYTASTIPIALRTVFPETVLQLGLIGLAAAISWLTIWMLRNIPSETAIEVADRNPAAGANAS
ncbi:hypothetical protein [Arthrobacter oryzae]|jgi:hypothetical protein|uniref:hypothetical protein n=1 Tax=Arthrobacter oryzae TaxID=409290 RepID=UPI00277F5375|nr:hypothetical protein [Arthrobacter oryzae]MDQ0079342.1 hypothetical protein [Arthrobacter oryzae]